MFLHKFDSQFVPYMWYVSICEIIYACIIWDGIFALQLQSLPYINDKVG